MHTAETQRTKAFRTGTRIVLAQIIAEILKDKPDADSRLTAMFEPLLAGTEAMKPANDLEEAAQDELIDLYSRVENNVRCQLDLPNASTQIPP